MLYELITNIVGSFFSALCFAVLFCAPRHTLWVDGLIGTLGWLGYWGVHRYNGSVFGASVLCSLILSICSTIAAKWYKDPIQIFFVPGLIPVVPGVTFFHAIQAMIDKQYAKAGLIFLDVLYIALGIVCGIGLSVIATQLWHKLVSIKKKRKTPKTLQ